MNEENKKTFGDLKAGEEKIDKASEELEIIRHG